MDVGEIDARISVVIPTYNGFERLQATIRSVVEQTLSACEIIVVDDGSTDATPQVKTLFSNRIRYVRIKNGGQQRARNVGVSLATGNWLAFLDHDDLWDAEYLAEVTALIRAHSVDLTLCNSRTWQERPVGGTWHDSHRFTRFAPRGYWDRVGADPSSRWTVLHRYDVSSYLEFHPSQTSMLTIRRDLYAALGGFDERMRGNGAENFEFELRALRAGRVGLIWRPLVTMVRHSSNASLDGDQMTMDVVSCLRFSLQHHELDANERAIFAAHLQKRLPAAIGGAFALGRYQDVRAFGREFRGRLSSKARIKFVVSALPPPVIRALAAMLGPLQNGWRHLLAKSTTRLPTSHPDAPRATDAPPAG